MPNATISGWGKCLPPAVLSNHDLEQLVDTSDEWITTRTGIKERRISHVEVSDLAEVASRHALAAAGKTAADLDLIILATCTGDSLIPSTASILQAKLEAWNAAAFDLNAACSGFVYALVVANNMIKAGTHRTVLVVGAEKLHFHVDFTDRSTCVLFGDGAGAVILEATDDDVGMLSSELGMDGSAAGDPLHPERRHLRRPRLSRARGEQVRDGRTGALPQGGGANGGGFGPCHRGSRADPRPDRPVDPPSGQCPHHRRHRPPSRSRLGQGVRQHRVLRQYLRRDHSRCTHRSPRAGRESSPATTWCSRLSGPDSPGARRLLRWGDRVEPIATSDAELPPNTRSTMELLEPNLKFFGRPTRRRLVGSPRKANRTRRRNGEGSLFVSGVALVTGASRGIGRAIAMALGHDGHAVAVNYASRADAAEEVVSEITGGGGKGRGVPGGRLRCRSGRRTLRPGRWRRWDLSAVLVNNAGITADNLVLRMSPEEFDRVIDTNLRSAFLCTKAALRGMIRARWGRVISISSVSGIAGNPGQANYAASKAGLIGFSKSVAKEVGSRGITVNVVAPGFITTDMTGSLSERGQGRACCRR